MVRERAVAQVDSAPVVPINGSSVEVDAHGVRGRIWQRLQPRVPTCGPVAAMARSGRGLLPVADGR